ncbi:Tex family protein [Lactiplantibacillus mudanjiangensis]|uniref:RNA-binding transcriptional accessory protein [Lactobacillus sp.] n=1 Tax=Lactiplantibacillus mudanjiangensis TaxID=1296538 RepID=A0A660E1P2_9LACO|nr:Tex family protein [Lactiplantibacillus mudanjiangensis]VDG18066.1 RNA-binding transcriptional accessory protein [Lactobacillus sp.] [Lactiplantibacillus mudanjiangensis]VDG24764.1 RNA-binding transcriptional accessory protein [Lactobacillus sp.] [Lactiplantibacillus mudanjiangensis]VDG28487.1 RNA-binding transcriptional accessory protein [Lactobacillus sp.] [Lactiplantibacillus mudanjiangensis]VDG31359.1 RNA-binding transcriptional accessory protein [Lactobacillus sp.] [Lactiplantibacillus 
MDNQILDLVAKTMTTLKPQQIKAVLSLMDEGNTVPFIARYRKERTGDLDEVEIRDIKANYDRLAALESRKADVIKIIEEQQHLTPALKQAILKADKLQTVEDLYLPYKQKRQTKATVAKAAGLQPLAAWLLRFPQSDVRVQAQQYVNADKDVADADAALAGAHEILAEAFGENAQLRDWVRNYTRNKGSLVVKVKSKGKALDEQGVYQQYYDFTSTLKQLVSYRVLAINRGEKEKVLRVSLDVDQAGIDRYLHFRFIGQHQGPAVAVVEAAYQDAYKRFIAPAIERELRNELSDAANEQAINVFGDNLYHLLMQAPLKGRVVLGFDPAYRTGCKLAVMDANGKFLDKLVIYPHKPAPTAKREAAAGEFKAFLEKYQVEMIAIGNGTASRESEEFVVNVLKTLDRPVYYVIVNEAGASVYSASDNARAEFPDLHVEQRSAISIGRRLQDPLAELIKIDPQAVGVGQYQHDVPQKALNAQLDVVIETAVNQVGVNLNTASPELLTHISGLSKTIAQNVVAYRNDNGEFSSRPQLKKVPRLGPKAYEQAVGFLRIIHGRNVFDNTDIHPESYPAAKALLAAAKLETKDVGTPAAQSLNQVDLTAVASETGVGELTLKDIVASLQKPGRDVRDTMPAPLLRQDVLKMADLKPGMQLQGTVRNVVDFGAFVDIGVKQDGLVHVSKLTDKFLKDPRQAVAVGDIVTVWVEEFDEQRQRIALTMIAPKDQDHDQH